MSIWKRDSKIVFVIDEETGDMTTEAMGFVGTTCDKAMALFAGLGAFVNKRRTGSKGKKRNVATSG